MYHTVMLMSPECLHSLLCWLRPQDVSDRKPSLHKEEAGIDYIPHCNWDDDHHLSCPVTLLNLIDFDDFNEEL